jgi:hypothetical protein
MTGSQIDPNIVSQDVTAFIATGLIAYPIANPSHSACVLDAILMSEAEIA